MISITGYIGYALFLVMGVTLGLIGAGGSILTIPILVYLFDIPPLRATCFSLFIVGVTSFVGAIRYRHLISITKGLLFAVPSVLAVFLIRSFALPMLPAVVLGVGRDSFLMCMLAIVMFIAGILMMRSGHIKLSDTSEYTHPGKVFVVAFGCGILMGFLGVGGGFLIIPAIVLLLGVEMKAAVATSLFIITINSAMGFLADQSHLAWQDYGHLLMLAVLSVGGLTVGIALNDKFDGARLKRGFAWLVTLLSMFIAAKEAAVLWWGI